MILKKRAEKHKRHIELARFCYILVPEIVRKFQKFQEKVDARRCAGLLIWNKGLFSQPQERIM